MGKSKYTFDDVIKTFNERNYKLLSTKKDYKNVESKLKYICMKHIDKGEQQISFTKLMNNRGCYYCGRERTEAAHRKPFDYEYDKLLAESRGFMYVDTVRENGIICIDFVCNKHKEFGVQRMRKNNMKRDTVKGCKFCKGDYPKEYILKKMEEINPDVELLEPYVNQTTRIKCRCKKHDVISYKTPQEILMGRGCYYCGLEKLSNFHMLSQKEFEQRLYEANSDIILMSKYKGMEFDVTVKCKKCGFEWNNNAYSLIINGTLCRKCSYHYKGEDEVIKILEKLKINYVPQYKFNECKDVRPLPFDFYLPDYNICIEYDGQQHFEPRFGEENFQKTLLHDEIKNKFCKDNNVKLLRIPYWEFNNIENILINKLINNKQTIS